MGISTTLREMGKPTIAAVNGACAGAGLSLACACDLRFAAETALFRSAFVAAGLSGDFGSTWLLPRIVGSAKARELCLLNAKVGAEEARSIGLCSDVFPSKGFLQRVLEAITPLAEASPLAVARMKQNLNDGDEVNMLSLALDGEADRHVRTAYHPDALEAGLSFMQKRSPRFTGLPDREPWQSSKL